MSTTFRKLFLQPFKFSEKLTYRKVREAFAAGSRVSCKQHCSLAGKPYQFYVTIFSCAYCSVHFSEGLK